MLIDTHAHLNFPDYKEENITDIIQRAKDNDIQYIINVGTSRETTDDSITLANNHSEIFATVGVHPHDAHTTSETDYEALYNLAKNNPRVVAIGEIGLDYVKSQNTPDVQKKVFKNLLSIAQELELPYIVHNREASSDVLEILKDLKYPQGVFHCFGGDKELAKEVLDLNMMISFTGIVTFKNAVSVQQAAADIPLGNIMLESDSPFLAPAPHRGKRNEPAYVSLVAQKISEIKGLALDVVKEKTSTNALNFFNKMAPKTA